MLKADVIVKCADVTFSSSRYACVSLCLFFFFFLLQETSLINDGTHFLSSGLFGLVILMFLFERKLVPECFSYILFRVQRFSKQLSEHAPSSKKEIKVPRDHFST